MTGLPNAQNKLDQYMQQVNRTPVMSREEEVRLARLFRKTQQQALQHRLIVANLRFVVKIAHQYDGYGFKLLDLVQEGNIGLLTAVGKFDPERGYRLVSYAVWWIRAYIQSFIMRNWSLVKVGTTQAQRRLFFRVRSERQRVEREAAAEAVPVAEAIAKALRVNPREVDDMEMRLHERDHSLDAGVGNDDRVTHQDLLPHPQLDQEAQAITQQLHRRLQSAIAESLTSLTVKERYVMQHRILHHEPPTLLEIGGVLKVSRERVRQIENEVIRKLRQVMLQHDVAA